MEKADQFYKTKLCPFLIMQKCNKGDSCTYAHSESELQPKRNLQKTKLCPAWKRGECSRTNCTYAHGYDELRATEGYFKTTICALWLKGTCHLGEFCRHAHGEDELHERTYRKTEKQKRVHRIKKLQTIKGNKKGRNNTSDSCTNEEGNDDGHTTPLTSSKLQECIEHEDDKNTYAHTDTSSVNTNVTKCTNNDKNSNANPSSCIQSGKEKKKKARQKKNEMNNNPDSTDNNNNSTVNTIDSTTTTCKERKTNKKKNKNKNKKENCEKENKNDEDDTSNNIKNKTEEKKKINNSNTITNNKEEEKEKKDRKVKNKSNAKNKKINSKQKDIELITSLKEKIELLLYNNNYKNLPNLSIENEVDGESTNNNISNNNNKSNNNNNNSNDAQRGQEGEEKKEVEEEIKKTTKKKKDAAFSMCNNINGAAVTYDMNQAYIPNNMMDDRSNDVPTPLNTYNQHTNSDKCCRVSSCTSNTSCLFTRETMGEGVGEQTRGGIPPLQSSLQNNYNNCKENSTCASSCTDTASNNNHIAAALFTASQATISSSFSSFSSFCSSFSSFYSCGGALDLHDRNTSTSLSSTATDCTLSCSTFSDFEFNNTHETIPNSSTEGEGEEHSSTTSSYSSYSSNSSISPLMNFCGDRGYTAGGRNPQQRGGGLETAAEPGSDAERKQDTEKKCIDNLTREVKQIPTQAAEETCCPFFATSARSPQHGLADAPRLLSGGLVVDTAVLPPIVHSSSPCPSTSIPQTISQTHFPSPPFVAQQYSASSLTCDHTSSPPPPPHVAHSPPPSCSSLSSTKVFSSADNCNADTASIQSLYNNNNNSTNYNNNATNNNNNNIISDIDYINNPNSNICASALFSSSPSSSSLVSEYVPYAPSPPFSVSPRCFSFSPTLPEYSACISQAKPLQSHAFCPPVFFQPLHSITAEMLQAACNVQYED